MVLIDLLCTALTTTRRVYMGEKLVIVESPAKAKTIEKFLGKGYTVKSSFGHICDLPKSALGIDIQNGFEPKYTVPAEKKKVVTDLFSVFSNTEPLPGRSEAYAKVSVDFHSFLPPIEFQVNSFFQSYLHLRFHLRLRSFWCDVSRSRTSNKK